MLRGQEEQRAADDDQQPHVDQPAAYGEHAGVALREHQPEQGGGEQRSGDHAHPEPPVVGPVDDADADAVAIRIPM